MDITAQEWKVNNGKIEVIPFVVEPSSKLSNVNDFRLSIALNYDFQFVCLQANVLFMGTPFQNRMQDITINRLKMMEIFENKILHTKYR